MGEIYQVTASAEIQRRGKDLSGTRRRCGLDFSSVALFVLRPPRALLRDEKLRVKKSSEKEAERRGASVQVVQRHFYTLADCGFSSAALSKAEGERLALVARALEVDLDPQTLGADEDFEAALRAAVLDEAMTGPLDKVRRAGALLSLPVEQVSEDAWGEAARHLEIDFGKKKPSPDDVRRAVLEQLAHEEDAEHFSWLCSQLTAPQSPEDPPPEPAQQEDAEPDA